MYFLRIGEMWPIISIPRKPAQAEGLRALGLVIWQIPPFLGENSKMDPPSVHHLKHLGGSTIVLMLTAKYFRLG
jgi:hypothetical protein